MSEAFSHTAVDAALSALLTMSPDPARAVAHMVRGEDVSLAEAALGTSFPVTLKEVWSRHGWLDLRQTDGRGERDPYRGMTLLSPQAIVEVVQHPGQEDNTWPAGAIPVIYCGGRDFLVVNHPSHHPDAVVSLSPELPVAASVGSFLVLFESDQDLVTRIRDEAWERDRPGWIEERSEILRRIGDESLTAVQAKALDERLAGLDVLLAMPLGRTQTKRLVDDAIQEVGADGLQDMKAVMEKLGKAGARLDIRLARRMASEALTATRSREDGVPLLP